MRSDADGVRQVSRTQPSLEEYERMGLGRFVVNRSTHPLFYVSAWPAVNGETTISAKGRYRLPQLNYNSVLVTVISNHYSEGAWWRLQDMLAYTEDQGYLVALEEVDDMSTLPNDAIGIMRACAAQLALDAGFEWCFMVDTDVLLEKDTLVRLLRHDRPVVFPYLNILKDHAPGAPISSPQFLKSGLGLRPVLWAAMSCMLFNTKVFNCLDHYSWHGHDYHFSQSLAHYGHRIFVDTDTVVDVTRGPSRHPSKPWEELWRDLERGFKSRQADDRDRRPPPGFDSAFAEGFVDKDGVYWAKRNWRHAGAMGVVTEETTNGEQPHA